MKTISLKQYFFKNKTGLDLSFTGHLFAYLLKKDKNIVILKKKMRLYKKDLYEVINKYTKSQFELTLKYTDNIFGSLFMIVWIQIQIAFSLITEKRKKEKEKRLAVDKNVFHMT